MTHIHRFYKLSRNFLWNLKIVSNSENKAQLKLKICSRKINFAHCSYFHRLGSFSVCLEWNEGLNNDKKRRWRIGAKTGMWANNLNENGIWKKRTTTISEHFIAVEWNFTWINIMSFSHRNIFSFRGPFYKISRVSSWPCRFSNNSTPVPLPKIIPALLTPENFSYSLFELWIAVIETNIKSNGNILENSFKVKRWKCDRFISMTHQCSKNLLDE